MGDESKLIPRTKIVIFNTLDSSTKLSRLLSIIQYHFMQKERILLAVQDAKAASFIDQWLWKTPSISSFYPHKIVVEPYHIPIAITMTELNLNQAKVLVHLREQIHPLVSQFQVVYELKDMTRSERYQAFQKRFSIYRAGTYPIIEQ
ncbi:MAG: hypothetical protein K0S74_1643 [Chlamydiales bacterium]|jgi:DNA polymerase IIIc chi subunit|nr:hypothetical protein [Chlamydiales bacterium]